MKTDLAINHFVEAFLDFDKQGVCGCREEEQGREQCDACRISCGVNCKIYRIRL